MKRFIRSTTGSVLIAALLGVGVYFGNIELQSYWGRQAVANTGLEVHSLSDAIAKAKRDDKLVFVDVSAIWCGTCRRLDNEVFSGEEVKAELNRRFVFSRLEYESLEGQQFIRERNVKGFPNLWVLDKDGRNVKRLRVMFDPGEFAAQLRSIR
ncbi:MAG: thioredoxin family protein [Acidobacteriota bacterium]|nr:thioredoxin family protein [Acidobacteriota bacterium]MDH3530329.1 thioredoxin family protein [Acidobacteriota bacterium]